MRHRTRTLEALLVSLASSWLDAILSSDMTTSMTHDTNLFCMANRDSDQLSFTPFKRQIPHPCSWSSRLVNLSVPFALISRGKDTRASTALNKGKDLSHILCPYDTRAESLIRDLGHSHRH